MIAGSHERRARRLVALYPPRWRARFGEELEQLLVEEMGAQGRCWRRSADVVTHALLTRLGVLGSVGDEARSIVCALRGLAAAGSVFVLIGLGLWSQLTVAWRWATPAASATRVGMVTMSAAALGLCLVAAVAVASLLWTIVRARGAAAARWSLLGLASATLFCLGCQHVAGGWPAAGGHLADGGLVPGGVARIAWAATTWISAYWIHPRILAELPAGELAWMALSPVLIAATAVSGARAMRELAPSRAALRWVALLGAVGVVLAAVFVAGLGEWMLEGGIGPGTLFQAGRVDELGLVALAVALLVAGRSVRCAFAATTRPLTG